VNRHWYLLVIASSSFLMVTMVAGVVYNIIQTYRQQIQAEWLLRRTKDYFKGTPARERLATDELLALHDIVVCHEISMHYHKTARKGSALTLPNQRIFM
jgi:hypothetical protein